MVNNHGLNGLYIRVTNHLITKWDDPPSVSLESQNLPQRHLFPKKKEALLRGWFRDNEGVSSIGYPGIRRFSSFATQVAAIRSPLERRQNSASARFTWTKRRKTFGFYVGETPRWWRGWYPIYKDLIYIYISQMLNVWHIYLHLAISYGKCRQIYHTLSIWVYIYIDTILYLYIGDNDHPIS